MVIMGGFNNRKLGRLLDGRSWDEMRVLAGMEGVILICPNHRSMIPVHHGELETLRLEGKRLPATEGTVFDNLERR